MLSHLLPVADYQRTGSIKKWLFVWLVHLPINNIPRATATVFLTLSKNTHIYFLNGVMCLVFPKYLKNQVIFLVDNHQYPQGKIHIVPGLDNVWI